MTAIGDVLAEYKELPKTGSAPPVLTLTEKKGFVLQSERFKKRLATEDTSNYKVVRRNDIAFNPYLLWAGALAQNLIVDEGVISPLYPTFRIRDGHDARYMARLLLSEAMVAKYDTIAFGSVPRRRRSSVKDFLGIEIPTPPPLDEQQRIAAILDRADHVRSMRREVSTQTAELAQSVFMDMFSGLPPSSFARVSDVCERITVGVVVKPASYYVYDGVPALRTLNVKPGSIDVSELVYFSQEDNDGPLAKSRLRVGDLVVSRTGRAGQAALVPPHLDGANAIDLIVISPRHDCVDGRYFEALLNSPVGARLVAGEQRGQIQQHFNVGSLKAAKLPFPELSRQREFARRIEQIHAVMADAEAQLIELDSVCASLQSRAFSGQL